MRKLDVIRAWGRILAGGYPSLSIEITRECPLRCPGCYAYEEGHLNVAGNLRNLTDFKGDDLVSNVLKLVAKHKPVHLSIVGGEPLVRFRELNTLLPKLSEKGIAVQLVTSAVREIPKTWRNIDGLYVVVSIDGLPAEHDVRRKPATYKRILKNIEGQRIVVHCTITAQTADREGYYEEFLNFWSARDEVRQVWMSLFTPQLHAMDPEILSPVQRERVINELASLKQKFPKLQFSNRLASGYRNPPQSPGECIFARTTLNLTADLEERITPCQFGGTPDCSQCGCMASAAITALSGYKVFNLVPLHRIYAVSDKVGQTMRSL